MAVTFTVFPCRSCEAMVPSLDRTPRRRDQYCERCLVRRTRAAVETGRQGFMLALVAIAALLIHYLVGH